MTTAFLRRMRATFRSLGVRNYRLYFSGQLVSVVGTWMQSVAQLWLVLKVLHGTPLEVGLTGAFQFLPVLLFGPWGGLVADRFDKRRTLIVTQAAMGVLAAALGVLDMTGVVRLWMVYGLGLLLGLLTLVDNPTRQAFAVEMVGPTGVVNAVSLSSAAFTGARIVGPAVAGAVIATGGLDVCFFVNAASFVGVIAALWMMRPEELHRKPPVARAKGQIREGVRYVLARPELRRPLLLVAILYTFSFNFSVLLLFMADRVFHTGSASYGLMLSCMGAGSLVGALGMAGQRWTSNRLISGSGLVFGAAVLGAGLAPSYGVELGLLVAVGLTSMVLMASTNSHLQLSSDGAMRGRVMALYAVVFLGSTPIGGTLAGWAVGAFGVRETMIAAGVIAVASSAVALWVALGRPRRAAALPLARGRTRSLPDPAGEAEAEGGALTA